MDAALHLVARFSRKVSEAGTDGEILPLLVDAMIENVGVSAIAIVRVVGADLRIVASRNLPSAFDDWRADADELGAELSERFIGAARGEFTSAHVRPMISHRDLFGMAVLLFRSGAESAPEHLELGDALLDLAAVALGHVAQLDELRRAHDELRRTQRALVQAEKLRALGQMASGVAHDLMNILNPLSMNAQLLERTAKRNADDDMAEIVSDMRGVIARGVQTIQRLRDYGRNTSESETSSVDLDRLAEEAAAIAKPRLAGSKVRIPRIVVELGAPPPVLGRSDEILNALVNLTINAIDAMKDIGGTVTVSTGVEDGRTFARVADTGPGMPPDVEARVFEPFFSTKGDQGTGLGLAMVYACMQHHAGSVDLVTHLGKGTAFTMRFPPRA